MKFNLKIQNLGKLADAEIAINNFTVFAGLNNTGKTFASKILYSSLGALSASVFDSLLENPLLAANDALRRLVRHSIHQGGKTNPHTTGETLSDILGDVRHADFMEVSNLLFPRTPTEDAYHADMERRDLADVIRGQFAEFEKEIEDKESSNLARLYIKNLDSNIKKITEILESDGHSAVMLGLRHGLHKNMLRNFQVFGYAELRRTLNQPSRISLTSDDFLFFSAELAGQEESMIEIHGEMYWKCQKISRMIYLESPIYWKLRDFLESQRLRDPRIADRIIGVPEYFYELASQIRQKTTKPSEFADLQERLTQKIGGKIDLGESGELFFEEAGKQIPFSLAAMGVANIGTLAFLIRRNLIDGESCLFIDEPEAHLHPEWQVEMVKTLFALAKGGVTVVVATHSVEFMKWIQVEIEENPDSAGVLAINHFLKGGEFSPSSQDIDSQIIAIKRELSKPYRELYLKGL